MMLSRHTGGDIRGRMIDVSMADFEAFALKWNDAGEHIVQYWEQWEEQAASFFGIEGPFPSEAMHGVMQIACCLFFQDSMADIKRVMRGATPSTLQMCQRTVSHLAQFAVLIEAETRFRARQLAADWTMSAVGNGSVVVRSTFRPPPKETEH